MNNEYRVPKGKVLGLRTTPLSMVSTADFVWPTQGYAAAPDWRNDDQPGGGLHALLWGEGDESHFSRVNTNFQVVEIDEKAVIDLGGKVKFPNCNVIYTGDENGARQLLHTARLPAPEPTVTAAAPETPTQQQAQGMPAYQEAKTIVSNPSYTQTAYTAPVYSRDTTPTHDPLVAAMLGGAALVGVVGGAVLAILTTGLLIAAALPVATMLVYAWKFRAAIWHGALFLMDCVEMALRLPFVLAYRGLQMAVQTAKTRQAQPVPALDVLADEPVLVMELPIAIMDWPRKNEKVTVKHGDK